MDRYNKKKHKLKTNNRNNIVYTSKLQMLTKNKGAAAGAKFIYAALFMCILVGVLTALLS